MIEKIYNPGFVKRFQKPWFKSNRGEIRYSGQFSDAWGSVSVKYAPLIQLINKVENEELRLQMLDLVDEMEDACNVCYYKHLDSLPSAD
jgi:hypothetical protein